MKTLQFFWTNTSHHAFRRPDLSRKASLVGAPEDQASRYNRYLCSALLNDFQSLGTCIQLLVEINFLERGKKTEFEWAGSAWFIKLRRGGVQIGHQTNCQGENEEGRFSLAEFKGALQGWVQFLEMPQSLEAKVEVQLPEA